MTTKYKLHKYNLSIDVVEVVKETKCFVYQHDDFDGKSYRESMSTEDHRYFDTEDDAKKYAVKLCNFRIDYTRGKLKKLLEIRQQLESEPAKPDKYAAIKKLSQDDRDEILAFAQERSDAILGGKDDA